jgi:hypothetical protein
MRHLYPAPQALREGDVAEDVVTSGDESDEELNGCVGVSKTSMALENVTLPANAKTFDGAFKAIGQHRTKGRRFEFLQQMATLLK